MLSVTTLAIFCRVVDNYGDIGICWRLARQLQHEHGVAVTLWVDHLPSFQRICPGVVQQARQIVEGVEVLHWSSQDLQGEPADVVIEFFGCELPPAYVSAMAARKHKPVWLNLEGLSAEEWVEGCHTLPSMHPRLPLTKHFYFPGFTDKTGGLLCERGLDAQRRQFGAAAFLAGLGVSDQEIDSFKISLFCYPYAPVTDLFAVWARSAVPITCLVPEGVAVEALKAWQGQGALRIRTLPFVPQADYDKLLWSCDFNFVRGEDSFVRAQWAAKPFIWHIYSQDENLHHKKLRAFHQRFGPPPALEQLSLHWNGAEQGADWPTLWAAVEKDLPAMQIHAQEWPAKMHALGDLASNLLAFAMKNKVE